MNAVLYLGLGICIAVAIYAAARLIHDRGSSSYYGRRH